MLSVHNSYFYLEVMREMRAHLAAGTFGEYRRQFAATYVPSRKILSSRIKHALKEEDRG
jgi:queuine/archaeosine tRNA-ribosyltransferase